MGLECTVPEPSPPTSFPFHRLPPEIQDLVWEAALPPRRVFHVSAGFTKDAQLSSSSSPSHGGFQFHIRHPPPPSLAVCRTARQATLRRGVFLAGPHGGWFRPDTDILYFDRNQRRLFHPPKGQGRDRHPFSSNPSTSSPPSASNHSRRHPLPSACAAVQHVGLEWRAFFSHMPRLRPGQDPGAVWRDAIAPLREGMPALKTLTYVLPMVRHGGGLSWGREPYGAQRFEAELVRLPEGVNVPWGGGLLLEPVPEGRVGRAMAELLDGRQSFLVPWGEMRGLIDGSLNIEEEDEEEEGEERPKKRELPKLNLTGGWLLRVNAEYDEEVRSFSE